jgi:sortase A
MDVSRHQLLRAVEGTCWIVGLIGLLSWGGFQAVTAARTRGDLARFDALRVASLESGTPDQSLWSPVRVSAWQAALHDPAPMPLAVLRIPRIRLEVPVLPGTADRTLDRGVGHIEDTALPGTDGNAGIAGHRDGFFRGLKDIAPGDAIEIETLHGIEAYRVERTWVVDPEDVSVLDPTPTRAVTLVTCYPFYYVGSAPRRFIVRAVLTSSTPTSSPRSNQGTVSPVRLVAHHGGLALSR